MIEKLSCIIILIVYFSAADPNEDALGVDLLTSSPLGEESSQNVKRQTYISQVPNSDYYGSVRKSMPNCKRGKGGTTDQQWINTYTQRVVKPSVAKLAHPSNTDLTSQSLKNEDYNNEYIDTNLKNNQVLDYHPNKFSDSFNDNTRSDKNNEDFKGDYENPLNPETDEYLDRFPSKHFSIDKYVKDVQVKTSKDIKKPVVLDKLITKSHQKNDDTSNKLNREMLDLNGNAEENALEDLKKQGISEDVEREQYKKYQVPDASYSKPTSKTQKTTDQHRENNCLSFKDSNDSDNPSRRFNEEEKGKSGTQELTASAKYANTETVESASSDTKGAQYYNDDDDLDDESENSAQRRQENQENYVSLPEPTEGLGVSRFEQSRLLLMETKRVCYACSSATNPTCWAPDRRTTVKYCQKGHDACVTKTFKTANSEILIRDCASSCNDIEGGIELKYKSCSVCHTNLCNDNNGALTINTHSLIWSLFLISFLKALF